MSKLTDLLDQVKQGVTEIEDEVRGASPLQARLDRDKADLEAYAVTLGEQTTALESKTKELADREEALNVKEAKLNELKSTLKAQQTELLKASDGQ